MTSTERLNVTETIWPDGNVISLSEIHCILRLRISILLYAFCINLRLTDVGLANYT